MFDRFRSTILALVLGIFALVATAAHAEPGALACAERWGKPGKPLVTNAETARAIFLAVEQDFFPTADPKAYPAVDVQDDGEHWTVFRWRPPAALPNGDLETTRGGGQLVLVIGKCDAAISNVHYSR